VIQGAEDFRISGENVKIPPHPAEGTDMRIRTPLLVTAAAATMLAGAALPAMAGTAVTPEPATTTTTFNLTGGGPLDVTVADTANWSDTTAKIAPQVITGSLGNVTVSDLRGTPAGWTVTATSDEFTGTSLSKSSDVQYDARGTTPSGTVSTGTPVPKTTIMTTPTASLDPVTVVRATANGDNSVTWSPNLDVTMPTSALPGLYTGHVATSVA